VIHIKYPVGSDSEAAATRPSPQACLPSDTTDILNTFQLAAAESVKPFLAAWRTVAAAFRACRQTFKTSDRHYRLKRFSCANRARKVIFVSRAVARDVKSHQCTGAETAFRYSIVSISHECHIEISEFDLSEVPSSFQFQEIGIGKV
jgi:hypothetical protein